MNEMNPVVHFEMGADDQARMVKFYETAFGWQTEAMGPEMGDYVVVTTSESDPNDKTGRPKAPGTINGGFYKRSADQLSKAPSVVVAVGDISEAMKKVEAAGGKILGAMNEKGEKSMEPQQIPGVGLWISFMDTEGNRVSMLQPKM